MGEYDLNETGTGTGNHEGLPQRLPQGLPQRRSIRLKGYDYSQAGLYFVTICCQNRNHLFGKIIDGKMALNDAGEMINNEWFKLTERFGNIKLHEYTTMPNHFHAILEIVGATLVVARVPVVAPIDATPIDNAPNHNAVNDNAPIDNAVNNNAVNDNGRCNGRDNGQPQGQPQGIAPTDGAS